MDLHLINTAVLLFLLMVIRTTGMVVVAPFFSQTGVPSQIQVGIAIVISFILFPIFSANAHIPCKDLWNFGFLAGQEFAVGVLIGFVASLFFAAVQLAGNHVTTQIGLNAAQVIDPMFRGQAPIMAQFYFILAITLFMTLNLHEALILAVAKSYQAIPLATGFSNFNLVAGRMTAMATELFSLSILLVLPVMGTMLVLDVILALMSKLAPQMNVFMVALPLKIAAGLALVYITLPYTMDLLTTSSETLVKHLLMLYQS